MYRDERKDFCYFKNNKLNYIKPRAIQIFKKNKKKYQKKLLRDSYLGSTSLGCHYGYYIFFRMDTDLSEL